MQATREINSSDKNVACIENLIEQLTKVRPHELSKDGLKLFNKINEIIDINKELEEENVILKKAHNISENVTIQDITNVINKSLEDFNKEYIPVSLVEEKRTKLKDQYNRVVNEINNQGMIDQLIDFKKVSAKLEMCEELLEKRKSKC